MRKLIVLSALALAIFGSLLVQTGYAAVESNEKVPFDGFTVFVPCANGGAGEEIVLNGFLHVVISTTFDNAGGGHFTAHFQPQGLTGTGQVTGDKYNGVGITRSGDNVFTTGATSTLVNNFYMIGTGPNAVRYKVHETFHITVNANGTVTATVDNLRITCD